MMEGVDIESFSEEKLGSLKRTLEENKTMLEESIGRLRSVTDIMDGENAMVRRLSVLKDSSQCLIPLTKSLYVPGSLTNIKKVLVDIGSGYYIKMNYNEAMKYYDRKHKFLEQKAECGQRDVHKLSEMLQRIDGRLTRME